MSNKIKFHSAKVKLSDAKAKQGNAKEKSSVVRPVIGRTLTVGAVSAIMGITSCFPLAATQAIAETVNGRDAVSESAGKKDVPQTAKNEVVYTKLDANGAKQGIYVVNKFQTATKTSIEDPGTYTNVTNLSTTEELSDEGGAVAFTTPEGVPFYYQGDLNPEATTLPWNVEVSYTLDGKSIAAEDLAGKSGDLDIELKITGIDDDSATADFAKSFLMQAQGTFDNDTFELDSAGDATIAEVGSQTLVTFLQLPGTDGDYHITGHVTDFSYSGWQISAMPLSLALDLNSFDTSELTDAIDELINASGRLADGAGTLSDGAEQLGAGVSALQTQGTSKVASGAQGLLTALNGQQANFEALENGSQQVADGVNTLATTLSQTLPATLSQAQQGVNGMKAQMGVIQGKMDGINQSAAGLNALSASIANHGDSLAAAMSGMQGVMGGLSGQLVTAGTDAATAASQAGAAATSAQSAQNSANAAASELQGLLDGSTLTADQEAVVRSALVHANEAATNAGSAVTSANGAAASAGSVAQTVQTAGTSAQQVMGSAAVQQLQADAQALAGDLQTLQTSAGGLMTSAHEVLSDSNALLVNADTMIGSISQNLGGLSSQMGQVTVLGTGASQVAAGAASLRNQLSAPYAADGSMTLYGGVSSLAAGSSALDVNAQTAAAGAQSVASGASQLKGALDTLRDSVSDMDQQVLEQLQEKVDEMLGKGYELHSFVAPSNTDVNEVEFVYVVAGISDTAEDEADETAGDSADHEEEATDESFFSLLGDLFTDDSKK